MLLFSRRQHPKQVLAYFGELNEGRATSAVFVDPERIHERELVLKNLRAITAGLVDGSARTSVGVAGVDTQCRHLLKQLLERFRQAVRKVEPALEGREREIVRER